MPYAPLAQLDRALVYGTKGWGFELLKVHQTKNSNLWLVNFETSKIINTLTTKVKVFFIPS